jgi:polyhydroxybutyrate depolymerase
MPRMRWAWAAVVAAGCSTACSTEVVNSQLQPDPDSGRGGSVVDAGLLDGMVGTSIPPDGGVASGRPYNYKVPRGYDGTHAVPLMILLHGYGAWGSSQDFYLGLSNLADAETFLYAYPDGTQDATGIRFWNATDACCNFYGSKVDDVGYISWIIDDMASRFKVDRSRVYLFGHSNGAFMAHRFACEHADKVAAFAALSGDNWYDWSKCTPSRPVRMVQLHGDLDPVIAYNGGSLFGNKFPSAVTSAQSWSFLNGCGTTFSVQGSLDLDAVLSGAETEVRASIVCAGKTDVELWTIKGAGHVPVFNSQAMTEVYRFLTR